ncbi:MAG: ammonium transporter [Gemmataceae bacterium]
MCFFATNVVAADTKSAPTLESLSEGLATLRKETNDLWTCVAAFLVFFMQAGFAMVESGFTRAKNAVNILMKNLMDFSVGTLAFWLVGFGLMFGTNPTGWIGTDNFLFSGEQDGKFNNHLGAFWIFQVVFAATAATIVSGAMAERTRFVGYLIYSAVISAFIYPVFGSWAWSSLAGLYEGKGWLEEKGFIDFAGSTVVHSVGGWAALVGAIMLGPRIGKYSEDGKPQVIPGHSIPLAGLGVFILWFGWFGFNPGSTTSVDGINFARVAVTTNLAAAAGAIAAMIISWVFSGKPDASFALNGALAGLVAITCPCATVTYGGAIVIGFLAGLLVYGSVLFFDKLKIDDPVGAVSVHGVCGAWGTLSAGIFGAEAIVAGAETSTGLLYGGGTAQFITQLIGIGACFAWVVATCSILFGILRVTGLLRVSEEDELKGLDVTEHAMHAYHMGNV